MVAALLLLLLLLSACVFFVGVPLWVVFSHFFTVDIPADIKQTVKLRILHCAFQLTLTWGTILEKLRICSMPQFIRFVHDLIPLKTDPAVVVTDLCFGTIPVKLYQPKASSSTLKTGIVYYHGGGGVLGSTRTHHGICRLLSKESDSVVVSVGYRQTPNFKFPVGTVDCISATIHFLRSLDTYGVDPNRVVVCGDSVGGGVSVVVCQKLMHCSDLPKIRAHIVIYAALQGLDFQSPSYQQNRRIPLLTLDFAFYCWSTYLNVSPVWKNAILGGAHIPPKVWEKYRKWLGPENIPEKFKKRGYRLIPKEPLNEDTYQEACLSLHGTISPLLADDAVVSRLPEACIVSCEYDLLLDHSLLYKKRLQDLGVPVTWYHMEDGFHGVLSTIEMKYLHFPCSRRILNTVVHFIKGL
ncbi:arylacetamide deacetylase-like 3 [Erinaceus europaeus]|uniref:Arylacetamide deacetylase-like 3 n=1 Tax=Erinaceus europaeus TaxID=9365 RepID=A0A1S3APA5_ERIEU|nr:arylacetamide deacetylase-like 3 [Erinaceus europaeus]